jgi:hypothetical protein
MATLNRVLATEKWAAAIIPLVLLTNSAAAADPKPDGVRAVTVCQLASRPQDFNSLQVRVSGKIEGNGIDLIIVTDDQCPELGVALDASPLVSKSSLVMRMSDAVAENRLLKPTERRSIFATITGSYHFQSDKIPRRLINMRSVQSLKIK